MERNATDFMRSIFSNASDWPTVIYSSVASHQGSRSFFRSTDAAKLSQLARVLPEQWRGRWLVNLMPFTLRTMRLRVADFLGVPEAIGQLANSQPAMLRAKVLNLSRSVRALTSERILPISTWAAYWPQLYATEGGPKLLKSLHHHSVCGEGKGSKLASSGPWHSIQICSPVAELTSKLVLHAAATSAVASGETSGSAGAPAGWQFPSHGRSHASESFQLCHDCPRSLLPVHIKPVPSPRCETLPRLRAMTNGTTASLTVWNKAATQRCPAACLATPPVDTPTQSGHVSSRTCVL